MLPKIPTRKSDNLMLGLAVALLGAGVILAAFSIGQTTTPTASQTVSMTQSYYSTEFSPSLYQISPPPTTTETSAELVVYTFNRFQLSGLVMLLTSIVVFGGAYVRINNYRTRVHIYYEILEYVAGSPRLATHIMRKCNLETGKFDKYIMKLMATGFVTTVNETYAATDKTFDYLRDRKIASFLRELP
jgi:predicted transcriptional regulator